MSNISGKGPTLESKDNCGVCGDPLIYGTREVPMQCVFCGEEHRTLIYCSQGHYVCDSCHGAEALDTLRRVLESTTSTDPITIMELVMSRIPQFPCMGQSTML